MIVDLPPLQDSSMEVIKFVEIKALEDAIAIIDSHYNWSADLRAATLELKALIN